MRYEHLPMNVHEQSQDQSVGVLAGPTCPGAQLRLGDRNEWMAYVWSSVPGAVLAASAALGWVPENVALMLFAVSFVGFNLMHMGATWARVYVRPGWQNNPVERLVVPLALAAFALGFEALGGGALLLALQYYLSFHHGLMQNYGLVRQSQRRDQRVLDPRIDLAACTLLPIAALSYRATVVNNVYSGAKVPALPIALIAAVALLGGGALLAFAVREWRSYRADQPVDLIGVGIMFGTNLLWSALLVADPHPAMPLYALASGHYAQYLYFVWRLERREGVAGDNVGVSSLFLRQVQTSPLRYLAGLLILAGGVTLFATMASGALRALAVSMELRPQGALAIPPWAAAMIGINLQHYWLDHRIWRAPRLPTVQPA